MANLVDSTVLRISQPTFISGAKQHFGKIELNTSLESMGKCGSENGGLS